MSCENLVCAACSGRVVEGRCRTCRASRDHVHLTPVWSTQLLVAAAIVLAVLAVVLPRLTA